jgi:HAD superfamily hydrolase (TIGR01509 family)
MPPDFDLVIFDCDGVLIDSEMLSASVLMQQLSELGIALSFDEFRDDFLGRSFLSASARLKARTGFDLPSDFSGTYFKRLNALFATDLKPMEGVEDVLDKLIVPHCVASSSIPPRLDFSIRICGLDQYFGSHIYSAAMVKQPKPAPDLFNYAAKAHNVKPARCLVIEDSELGVRAALAAGMTVWHFAGGAHIKAGYRLPPDLHGHCTVQNMAELALLFREAGLFSADAVANTL